MKKVMKVILVLSVVLCTSQYADARGGKGGGRQTTGGRNAMSQQGNGNAMVGNMQRMMMQNRYRMMQFAQNGQGTQNGQGAMLQQQLRYRYGFGQAGLGGQANGFQASRAQGFQGPGNPGIGMGNGVMQQQKTQIRLRNGQPVGGQPMGGQQRKGGRN